VLHGQMSYLLQDEDGQILEAHSISAGLDYRESDRNMPFTKTTIRSVMIISPMPKHWTPLYG
jgi:tryptophan synthase beta subunit